MSTTLSSRIEEALLSSSLLQPLHVEVINLSSWYYLRHRLGSKRQQFYQIKYNESHLYYEGYIYQLIRREEDLEVVPKKVCIGHGPDRLHAWQLCQKAIKERDQNEVLIRKDILEQGQSLSLLEQYYHIRIVSAAFQSLAPLDRLALVWTELVQVLGLQPVFNSDDLALCPPSQMKHFSSFGPEVLNLPIFRFLPNRPPEIGAVRGPDGTVSNVRESGGGGNARSIVQAEAARGRRECAWQISCLTPAQWKPHLYPPVLSERLGRSRQELGGLGISKAALPASQRHRVHQLVKSHGNKEPVVTLPATSGGEQMPMTGGRAEEGEGGEVAAEENHPNNNDEEEDRTALFTSSVATTATTTTTTPNNLSSSSISANALGDTLGLDPTVSGVTYSKLGGIYGHFFRDLSEDVRALVLERYQHNKQLIRLEGHATTPVAATATTTTTPALPPSMTQTQPRPSFQPKTNLSRLRTRIQAEKEGLAEPDRGTMTPSEMREEVIISNKRIEQWTIRLQRVRRQYMIIRMRKRLWKRFHALLTIQRYIRGYFGRRYVNLWKRLQPLAALRIQKCYRALRSNHVLYQWQWTSYRLTRIALRHIKTFFLRCYQTWMTRRDESAILIQSIVRQRIAMTKKYLLRGQAYLLTRQFPQCIIKIQKVYRGWKIRKYFYQIYLENELIQRIDQPAALRIQRIFRGRLAKKYLIKLRIERIMAIRIQKLIRFFLLQCLKRKRQYARLQILSANTIQRYYRGYLDRQYYHLCYHQHWMKTIYLPAVIYLQAWIRMISKRNQYHIVLHHRYAARCIYRAYQYYKTRWEARLHRQEIRNLQLARHVIVIQTMIRRVLAQKKFQRKLLAYRGKVIYAAKVIIRCWKAYKLNQKYLELLDDHLRDIDQELIKRIFNVRQHLLKDIQEMYQDIQHIQRGQERNHKRKEEIDIFLSQTVIRQVTIKQDMEQLTVEDYERGWAEALGQEYEYLLQQSLMAKEERRLINQKLYLSDREILSIQLEIEENEVELDEIEQRLLAAGHKAHRRELSIAERKANIQMRKRIFREAVHWKVDSNRKLKMLRARPRYNEILNMVKANRGLGYASTISFEKKRMREDYEELWKEKLLKEEASRMDEIAKPKTYEEYAKPVMKDFDRIVARNLGILRGLSLDDRARTLKNYFQQQKAAKKKLQRGQFASLKPEFEDLFKPKLV